MLPDFELCPGLHEGRHDVGHFGNATGRGVLTGAGQLSVFAGCEGFRLTSLFIPLKIRDIHYFDGIKKLAPKKGTRTFRGTTLVIARQTPSNHFIDITTRLKPAYLYSLLLVPVAARRMNSKLHWYGVGSQSPAYAPCRPFTIFTTSRSKHFCIQAYILHVIIQYYTNSNQELCAYCHRY